jgi:hypothetical protein
MLHVLLQVAPLHLESHQVSLHLTWNFAERLSCKTMPMHDACHACSQLATGKMPCMGSEAASCVQDAGG